MWSRKQNIKKINKDKFENDGSIIICLPEGEEIIIDDPGIIQKVIDLGTGNWVSVPYDKIGNVKQNPFDITIILKKINGGYISMRESDNIGCLYQEGYDPREMPAGFHDYIIELIQMNQLKT